MLARRAQIAGAMGEIAQFEARGSLGLIERSARGYNDAFAKQVRGLMRPPVGSLQFCQSEVKARQGLLVGVSLSLGDQRHNVMTRPLGQDRRRPCQRSERRLSPIRRLMQDRPEDNWGRNGPSGRRPGRLDSEHGIH